MFRIFLNFFSVASSCDSFSLSHCLSLPSSTSFLVQFRKQRKMKQEKIAFSSQEGINEFVTLVSWTVFCQSRKTRANRRGEAHMFELNFYRNERSGKKKTWSKCYATAVLYRFACSALVRIRDSMCAFSFDGRFRFILFSFQYAMPNRTIMNTILLFSSF